LLQQAFLLKHKNTNVIVPQVNGNTTSLEQNGTSLYVASAVPDEFDAKRMKDNPATCHIQPIGNFGGIEVKSNNAKVHAWN